MRVLSKCLVAAAAASASLIVPASATPLTAPFGLQRDVASTLAPQVQTVQYRRGGRGGYWRGGRGIGPAIVGSAIIGGAFAATRPYGYGYYGNSGYYAYDRYDGAQRGRAWVRDRDGDCDDDD
jgi:hypothetical protein